MGFSGQGGLVNRAPGGIASMHVLEFDPLKSSDHRMRFGGGGELKRRYQVVNEVTTAHHAVGVKQNVMHPMPHYNTDGSCRVSTTPLVVSVSLLVHKHTVGALHDTAMQTATVGS